MKKTLCKHRVRTHKGHGVLFLICTRRADTVTPLPKKLQLLFSGVSALKWFLCSNSLGERLGCHNLRRTC
jgi:hypothetical protein